MEPLASRNGTKPHAVCIPYPLQGHIKPMLKLANLLHHNGFHITFVNTEFNHRRFLKSRGLASLDSLPDFQFAAIPDGLAPSDPNASQDLSDLANSTSNNFLAPFLGLVTSLNEKGSENNVPPVSCIVSDGFMMKFTVAAADELKIPIASFNTISASAFMLYRQFRNLKNKGLAPFKDESYLTNEAYLNTTVDWIPGIKDIRLRDFPSFLRTTDQNDAKFHLALKATEISPKDSAIIFHTFDKLEEDVLEALSSYFPHIHTVGPLELLVNQIPEQPLDSLEASLWKEDTECLQWLDSKQPNSVVYVNFGSITVMTPQRMVEFGWGLANSKHPFLWVIRPDLVAGETPVLPPEFVQETKERGLVVRWCPQEKVLNHPSIGGFLTHCGWNSTIESISAGVPMLCWPFFAEQQTNCWFSCKECEIGMEIDSNAERDELEKLVRELMEGEKGKELKKNVMSLKKKAEEATAPGGSSATSFDKLVKKLLETKFLSNMSQCHTN